MGKGWAPGPHAHWQRADGSKNVPVNSAIRAMAGKKPAGPSLPTAEKAPSMAKHLKDGKLSAERQALHDKIVADALEGHRTQKNPSFDMMGGGTASGKSSMLDAGFVKLPTDCVEINADKIMESLPEYRMGDAKLASANCHEEASYLAKRIMSEGLGRKVNINLDGTGNGSYEGVLAKITAARAAGYKTVKGHYASLSVELAKKLSYIRAQKSRRWVPDTVLMTTHAEVSRIFPRIATLFDSVELYDTNIKDSPRLVATAKLGGSILVKDPRLWADFLAKGA